jgi:hypothetical protein
MRSTNRGLLVALLLMFARSCHTIALSSPLPNSVLVVGSTVPISWSGNTTDKTVVFDILLNIYKPETTKNQRSTVSVLATDIDVSANQPIIVLIPSSLNLTKEYSISLKKASRSYSSVGPLQLVPSEIDESNDTPSSVTQQPTLMVSRHSPEVTSTPLPVSLSLDEANNANTAHDIGPTLTSAKAACIAMSVVLFASAVFGIYVLIRNIIQRRRQQDTDEVNSSNHNSDVVTGYYTSPATINERNKMTDNMEVIRDYQGLYYTEGFTDVEPYGTVPDKTNRKRPTSSLRVSNEDHPFGKPPQSFNHNAYYIYNELPLPPQQAYGSYHMPTAAVVAENRAASRSSNRRMSSPTIPPMSPTLSHTK